MTIRPALDHAGKACLGHVETAAKIDPHHLVPVIEAHLVEHPVAGDPGVVDDDVDRAVGRRDVIAIVNAGFVIAHVPAVGRDPGRRSKGLGLFVVAAIIGDNGVALLLKAHADRLADAPGPPGYDRHTRHDPSFPVARIDSPTASLGTGCAAGKARKYVKRS